MKKVFGLLSFIFVLLLVPIVVKAIEIDKVDIDVYIDNDGNAHVTEKWINPKPTGTDTEFYKAYDNLGEMEITDFSVMYNNQLFTYEEDWDIDKSFSEKAYKNGLYYEDGKTELCFGITNYTSGTYTMTYTIKKFIVKLEDADMVYFNFIPSGNTINDFHLKLYSDSSFSDELPVWGYGKKNGTAYVYDGYVEMNSESIIKDDEYITLLIKFDKDTFSTQYLINNNFEHYLDLAKKGSKTSVYSNPVVKFILGVLGFIFSNIWVIIIIIITFVAAKASKNKIGSYKYDFGKTARKLPKEVNKIRDIPFNDIYKVYLYSTVYYLNKNKTDLLGAVLLKWLKEKKIKVTKVESKILKKEESAIVLDKDFTSDNNLEVRLHNMMYEASRDGILESKEFEKWCRSNYDRILKWFDNILDYETERLISENVLQKNTNDLKLHVTDIFINEATLVKGVKEFLLEFSRIDDKEAIEVNMWEYYLIYAQIFGIADKVAKQFKKLYPNEIANYEERYGYSYSDIMFVHTVSSSVMSSAISSRDRANAYSSGGGGFMSGGGGGGSFGGGGSMGSR